MITPNETESEKLTGVPVTDERSAEWAAQALRQKRSRGRRHHLGQQRRLCLE